MNAIIILFLIGQVSIGTQGGAAKILGEKEIPKESMEMLQSIRGSVYMGVSRDSAYIFLNETPIKVDKGKFNFRDLPKIGEMVYVRLEKRGKEMVAVKAGRTLQDVLKKKAEEYYK